MKEQCSRGRIFAADVGNEPTIEYLPEVGLTISNAAGERAILLYVDGACRGNGTPSAKASTGIYAGPGHPKTRGCLLPRAQGKLTNQTAELHALISGVEVGVAMVQDANANTGGENSGITLPWATLVIASDSAYACGGITKWNEKWRQTEYKDVQNAHLFKRLDHLVSQAAVQNGITIKFWAIKRDDNEQADALARRALEEAEEIDRDQCEKWQVWLQNEWYGDVVSYHLFGMISDATDLRLRKARRDITKFMLVDEEGRSPGVAYKESNGELAVCVMQDGVSAILHRFHDNHGHFATGIMNRNILGRYYWPGRFQDIARWCISCNSCQRMGPRRNSTQVRPIVSLQPMDLLGMDFIGPITPNSRNGSVYILVVVDYFSRYLFAHATKRSTGTAVVEFLRNITKVFGWPLAMYTDNGSHFVKGELPGILKSMGTLHFAAPITNPRSVGLAERYVQLVLTGLRTQIAACDDRSAMERWDEFLDSVVFAINTRVLRVHGYTPSQLFLGFNVRMHPLDRTLTEELRQHRIIERIDAEKDDRMGSEGRHGDDIYLKEYELRLAQVEEMRELTRERVLYQLERYKENAKVPRYQAPQLGDLVLRRRFQVEKSLGMKLHTKWDGPYRLSQISKSGVSGYLQDLKTGSVVGRYAFESLKVFVPREEELPLDGSWVSLCDGLSGIVPQPRLMDLRNCINDL